MLSRLAVPGQKVRSSDLIQTKYVTDSVEKGELLDVEEYRSVYYCND